MTVLLGDCRDRLRELEPGSVRCCVTSPPYWGLRDYGTATWEGGDPECDHSPERRGGRFSSPVSSKQASNVGSGTASARDCSCGARRIDAQLGLESTPEEYVSNMVEVFRLVRDALADDGTLWLNLGDSYTSGGRESRDPGQSELHPAQPKGTKRAETPPGLKPKDLVGIPWRVAFALQADGWYLRSDIIWSKPNPMPESVTDCPTKAHEYLFLLSKSERYYYDAEAIAEPAIHAGITKMVTGPHGGTQARGKGIEPTGNQRPNSVVTINDLRNRRTVWTVATQPYADAHFATFPPALIEPCILAGSAPGDLVLDPFGGSGTTGQVAQKLGRRFVLIELQPKYLPLIERRTAQQALAL